MAKRKRTREEKKLADLRLTHSPQQDNTVISDSQNEAISSPKYTFTFKPTNLQNTQTKATAISTSYSHLRGDLRKTAILTASIIIGQIVLYFIVNYL